MKHFALSFALAACLSAPGAVSAQSGSTIDLTDAQMEELVAAPTSTSPCSM